MASILNLAFLLAASAAVSASAAPTSAFILNNGASGVHTGTPASEAADGNRVVYAHATAAGEIEILRADNAVASSSSTTYAVSPNGALLASQPFASFSCGANTGGKKGPVLVYPKTSMPEVADDQPLRIYFVCAETDAAPFGTLYTASSVDLGESWDVPTALATATPVALKGLGPMIAGITKADRWVLPVQSSTCSFSFVALDAFGTTVNASNSLAYCADKNDLQVTAASWTRVPNAEADMSAANKRIVLFTTMATEAAPTAVTPTATACSLDMTDCSDAASWVPYTPSALGEKGTLDAASLPTGETPSLIAVANMAAAVPAPSAQCIAAVPQLLLASETMLAYTNEEGDNVNKSFVAFQLAGNISAVFNPSQRTLVGALLTTGAPNGYGAAPSAADIAGITVVPLAPTAAAAGKGCVAHYGFLISIIPANASAVGAASFPAYISGSFTSEAFDPSTVPDQSNDDGDPALAAAITFIIIGVVCLILGVIFVIGFIRNRKAKYDEVPADEANGQEHQA